ncbi:hypothetical protein AB1Y20_009030 [Prymnesium parvum]|uniref:SidE PDE domain-containing protein n=1 Tax=Prymnesium parvum TaxID=97485 RepID=A0AB34K102_PRYPA
MIDSAAYALLVQRVLEGIPNTKGATDNEHHLVNDVRIALERLSDPTVAEARRRLLESDNILRRVIASVLSIPEPDISKQLTMTREVTTGKKVSTIRRGNFQELEHLLVAEPMSVCDTSRAPAADNSCVKVGTAASATAGLRLRIPSYDDANIARVLGPDRVPPIEWQRSINAPPGLSPTANPALDGSSGTSLTAFAATSASVASDDIDKPSRSTAPPSKVVETDATALAFPDALSLNDPTKQDLITRMHKDQSSQAALQRTMGGTRTDCTPCLYATQPTAQLSAQSCVSMTIYVASLTILDQAVVHKPAIVDAATKHHIPTDKRGTHHAVPLTPDGDCSGTVAAIDNCVAQRTSAIDDVTGAKTGALCRMNSVLVLVQPLRGRTFQLRLRPCMSVGQIVSCLSICCKTPAHLFCVRHNGKAVRSHDTKVLLLHDDCLSLQLCAPLLGGMNAEQSGSQVTASGSAAIVQQLETGTGGAFALPPAKKRKHTAQIPKALSTGEQSTVIGGSSSTAVDGRNTSALAQGSSSCDGGEESNLGPGASCVELLELELCNEKNDWSYKLRDMTEPVRVLATEYHRIPQQMLTTHGRISNALAKEIFAAVQLQPGQTREQVERQFKQAMDKKINDVSKTSKAYNGEWQLRRAGRSVSAAAGGLKDAMATSPCGATSSTNAVARASSATVDPLQRASALSPPAAPLAASSQSAAAPGSSSTAVDGRSTSALAQGSSSCDGGEESNLGPGASCVELLELELCNEKNDWSYKLRDMTEPVRVLATEYHRIPQQMLTAHGRISNALAKEIFAAVQLQPGQTREQVERQFKQAMDKKINDVSKTSKAYNGEWQLRRAGRSVSAAAGGLKDAMATSPCGATSTTNAVARASSATVDPLQRASALSPPAAPLAASSQSAAAPGSSSTAVDGRSTSALAQGSSSCDGGEESNLGPGASCVELLELELCNEKNDWSYKLRDTTEPVRVLATEYHRIPQQMLTAHGRISNALAKEIFAAVQLQPGQTREQVERQFKQAMDKKINDVSKTSKAYNGEWQLRRAGRSVSAAAGGLKDAMATSPCGATSTTNAVARASSATVDPLQRASALSPPAAPLAASSQSAAAPGSSSTAVDGRSTSALAQGSSSCVGGEESNLGPGASCVELLELELCNEKNDWSYKLRDMTEPVRVLATEYHRIPQQMLTAHGRISNALAKEIFAAVQLQPGQTREQVERQFKQAMDKKINDVSKTSKAYNGEWQLRRAGRSAAAQQAMDIFGKDVHDLSAGCRLERGAEDETHKVLSLLSRENATKLCTILHLADEPVKLALSHVFTACLKYMGDDLLAPETEIGLMFVEAMVKQLNERMTTAFLERLGALLKIAYSNPNWEFWVLHDMQKRLGNDVKIGAVIPGLTRVCLTILGASISGSDDEDLVLLRILLRTNESDDEDSSDIEAPNETDELESSNTLSPSAMPGSSMEHRSSTQPFDFRRAAKDAYDNYYQERYDGKPRSDSVEKLTDFAVEHRSWEGIEQSNHGIAHAIRKAMLVTHVASAYCEAYCDANNANNLNEFKLPASQEAMQLAMLLEGAGRRSEVGITR